MDPFASADLFAVFGETATVVQKESNEVQKGSSLKRKESSTSSSSSAPSSSSASPSSRSSLSSEAAGAKKVKREDVVDEVVFDEGANSYASKGKKVKYDSFAEYKEQVIEGSAQVTSAPGEKGCASQVCFPPDWDFTKPNGPPPPGRKPAKMYPFVLDPFQQKAVESIEKNQSVLVSAHTSAGKTVVAEYAIAVALRDKQRVIYTSPIKALSNQKYRELHEEFHDVGLMTGDITINPSASCLVMTTEILRNMLYRGSEVMREVAWVIFDEIHYMRDKSRGVVWEETIILLPQKCRLVFLSATIPNASEFASWVAKLKSEPCNVVYTDYRPTPLQHYVFPSGGAGLYLVVDDKGVFREQNFQKAVAVLTADGAGGRAGEGSGDGTKKKKKGGGKGEASDMYKIVKLIMEKHYEPCIVFSFSKRDCENHALALSKLDFNEPDEKKLIHQIFTNAVDSLNEDDKLLPQVQNILPLLKRGIGIHHGGLLPILKEVIEILFQEGLVKVLFSTETFSMGLNMPARTVVFTSFRKFDGDNFRSVTPGEYIQMSGRAGRRGLDDKGIVMLMLDEKLDMADAKDMMKGQADPLHSSFHLGYNMLLNLLRVEDADPEFMMARSFFQFQQNRQAPKLRDHMLYLEDKKVQMEKTITDMAGTTQYWALLSQIEELKESIRQIIIQPDFVLPFLNPGRLVKVLSEEKQAKLREKREKEGGLYKPLKVSGSSAITMQALNFDFVKEEDAKMVKQQGQDKAVKGKEDAAPRDWDWGVVVNFQKKRIPGQSLSVDGSGMTYIVDVLVKVDAASVAEGVYQPGSRQVVSAQNTPRPPRDRGGKGEPLPCKYVVIPVALDVIEEISAIRMKMPPNADDENARIGLGHRVDEAKRRCGTVPLLDPVANMKIQSDDLDRLQRKLEAVEDRLKAHKLSSKDAAALKKELDAFGAKVKLEDDIARLAQMIKNASNDAVLRETLKNMKRVLRRLNLVKDEDVIDVKGRVAAELSTCDELVGTEMIFSGVFNDLTPEQTCALLSVMVFDEQNEEETRLKEELAAPMRQTKEIAKKVGQVIVEAKLPLDLEKFVNGFQPHLMDVVYAWAKGAKFADLCKMTDVFEGTIIRVMRRLEELIRQLAAAAKEIGNEHLYDKFNLAIEKIKRDIIFAASLYL